MTETLLTVRHAAERLDVSPKTVYRLIYAGLLQPRNIGLGKKRPRVRVPESELRRYMAGDQSETPPADAQPPSRPPSTPPPPSGPTPPPRTVARARRAAA